MTHLHCRTQHLLSLDLILPPEMIGMSTVGHAAGQELCAEHHSCRMTAGTT